MQFVTLEFTRNFGAYIAGSIASFPPLAAENIVKTGAAKYHQAAKPAQAVLTDRKSHKIVKK